MNILLAVDGSDPSFYAAQALAHLPPADKLVVLHVLDVPNPAYPMMAPEVAQDLFATVEREMREEGKRMIERAAAMLPPGTGPVSKRLELGPPAETILTVAEVERARLIVLGARGLGAIKELLLGSVSHRVLTHATCPVLAVRKPLRSLKRLLLAVQGPDDAEPIVQFLSKHPFRNPVEVRVLTILPFTQPVWPTAAMIPESLRKDMVARAKQFADGVAAKLDAKHYRATGDVVEGAPAPEIVRAAASHQADLIVMGSRGRKSAGPIVLGSVSHAVTHHAPCSVLVVR
ncbi:MAG: universal stress protein [Nitrospirae bacterium]|nr:universal stress protein [Nitrospirota bacterium]